MPRPLPWLQNGQRPKLPQPPNTSGETAVTDGNDAVNPDEIGPMIPGWENDDGWRMVEDELLEIARSFTRKLHKQEYERRLLDNARTRGRRVREDIAKALPLPAPILPTVVASVLPSKRNHSGDEGFDSDQEVRKKLAGTALEELMTSPRKRMKHLNARRKPATRAAAGFKSSSSTIVAQIESRDRPLISHRFSPSSADESTDSDDLDNIKPSSKKHSSNRGYSLKRRESQEADPFIMHGIPPPEGAGGPSLLFALKKAQQKREAATTTATSQTMLRNEQTETNRRGYLLISDRSSQLSTKSQVDTNTTSDSRKQRQELVSLPELPLTSGIGKSKSIEEPAGPSGMLGPSWQVDTNALASDPRAAHRAKILAQRQLQRDRLS